jgi:chemotaxis response regulator CheB
MSENGQNTWDVSFSRITFLGRILNQHPNVKVLSRHDDIAFTVDFIRGSKGVDVVVIDPYTASLELVQRVIAAFPNVGIIFVGGKWAGWTQEAYQYCQERRIGIFNAGGINGALGKEQYWTFEKIDRDGNSTNNIHSS